MKGAVPSGALFALAAASFLSRKLRSSEELQNQRRGPSTAVTRGGGGSPITTHGYDGLPVVPKVPNDLLARGVSR